MKPSTQNQKYGEVIDSNYAVYISSECGLFDCKAVILDGIKYKDIEDIKGIIASNFAVDQSLEGIPFHVAHS